MGNTDHQRTKALILIIKSNDITLKKVEKLSRFFNFSTITEENKIIYTGKPHRMERYIEFIEYVLKDDKYSIEIEERQVQDGN